MAVIEDDESFRVALVDSLSSLGYDARAFASVEEFIAGDGTEPYGCVITDIHLPGMSGFDLVRRFPDHRSNLPVVMITRHAEPELEARAIGGVCLLGKPFKADALTRCLERALKA